MLWLLIPQPGDLSFLFQVALAGACFVHPVVSRPLFRSMQCLRMPLDLLFFFFNIESWAVTSTRRPFHGLGKVQVQRLLHVTLLIFPLLFLRIGLNLFPLAN